MRILVACEESQELVVRLRALGLEAFSCDVLGCGGGFEEWHYRGDVRGYLGLGWDAVLAFPPCTHLSSSGARWWGSKRADGRQQEGIDFFMLFTLLYPYVPRVAIENPVGLMSTFYRKPDQVIQPWQFGHGETKATCLWLYGLPLLRPTNVVSGRESRIHRMPPSADRGKKRSRTYPGIAQAMAEQWFG